MHCCVLCCLVIAFLWLLFFLHFFAHICTFLHFFALHFSDSLFALFSPPCRYPTTDLPVAAIRSLEPLYDKVRVGVIPFIERVHGLRNERWNFDDLFVVKYDAAAGRQRQLATHADGSTWSFTVLLNPRDQFAGGGDVVRGLRPGRPARAGRDPGPPREHAARGSRDHARRAVPAHRVPGAEGRLLRRRAGERDHHFARRARAQAGARPGPGPRGRPPDRGPGGGVPQVLRRSGRPWPVRRRG